MTRKSCAVGMRNAANQNLKQNPRAVFSHKEDSRAFRQLNVPCFPTLYTGLLLFPAVVVFAKLSTNHGWFLFPRFSSAVLFTGYTYIIFPRFPLHVVVSPHNKCCCRALKRVNLVVFPAFFFHVAHVSLPRAFYHQRTFAPNFHYLIRLFGATLNGSVTILELSLRDKFP